MADAYCGPSNALQNFQKHTSVDRTLQQDRLSSRRLPLESFRSPEANAGILDPEFEAFQAGHPGPLPFGEPAQLPFHQSPNQRGKQPAFGGSHTPDWASDFQRLRVSTAPPSQRHAVQPLQSRGQSMQKQDVGVSRASMQPYTSYQPRYAGAGGFMGINQGFMPQHAPMDEASQMTAQSNAYDTFDEAAFERAFDAAREQISFEEDSQITHEQDPVAEELLVSENVDVAEESRFDADNDAALQEMSPFPYLSLLRINLAAYIRNPTEQNMHRAAVLMSLLEQHDPLCIDKEQRSIFTTILSALSLESRAGPFAARYNLPERARKLLPYYATRDDVGSNQEYESLLMPPALRSRTASVHQKPSAADADMREDVEMQLDGLKSQDLATKVFTMVSPDVASLSADPQFAQDARDALELEANVGMPRSLGWKNSASNTDLYDKLFNDSRHYTFADEATQLRQRLTTEIPWQLMQREDRIARLESARATLLEIRQQRQAAENTRLANLEQDLMDDFMPQDDPNELARTAGQLLDRVSDNTTDKFQNSAFLTLMRRLRDGEVKVQGDKVVESLDATAGPVLDGAKPDYVPPPVINQVHAVPPTTFQAPGPTLVGRDVREQEMKDGMDVLQHIPDGSGGIGSTDGDVRAQERRDGSEVRDLLNGPNDQDLYMGNSSSGQDIVPPLVTSPFYDNQHAELGRRGTFDE